MRTFSSTVRPRKGRTSWNVRARPRRQIRWGGRPFVRPPRNCISPESGTSAPLMRLNKVVLPDPFGPITPRISPASTVRLTFFTAATPPKLLEILSRVRRVTGFSILDSYSVQSENLSLTYSCRQKVDDFLNGV